MNIASDLGIVGVNIFTHNHFIIDTGKNNRGFISSYHTSATDIGRLMISDIPYHVDVKPLSTNDVPVIVSLPQNKALGLKKPTLYRVRHCYEQLLNTVVTGGWTDDNTQLTHQQLRELMHLNGMTFSHSDQIRKNLNDLKAIADKGKYRTDNVPQALNAKIIRAFTMPTIMAQETTLSRATKIADFLNIVKKEDQFNPQAKVPVIMNKAHYAEYIKTALDEDSISANVDMKRLDDVDDRTQIAIYPYFDSQPRVLTGEDVARRVKNLLYYLV